MAQFTYVDGKLIRQTGGSGTIDFIYGAGGAIGFKFAGTTYIYRRNLMGDVTHIYTTDGALGGLVSGPAGTSVVSVVTKFLKHPIKNLLTDLSETLLMDFTNWYSQFVIEGVIDSYA